MIDKLLLDNKWAAVTMTPVDYDKKEYSKECKQGSQARRSKAATSQDDARKKKESGDAFLNKPKQRLLWHCLLSLKRISTQ